MMNHIEDTAQQIVNNYGWVADRDVPEMTAEQVFDWYAQERYQDGDIDWEDVGEVTERAAAIWKSKR